MRPKCSAILQTQFEFNAAFLQVLRQSRLKNLTTGLAMLFTHADKIPRSALRRWQIHLSTVLVMTLVSGVMLGANLKPHPVAYDGDGQLELFHATGFPLHYKIQSMSDQEIGDRAYLVDDASLIHQRPTEGSSEQVLFLDVLLCLALTIVLSAAFEWVLRYREHHRSKSFIQRALE